MPLILNESGKRFYLAASFDMSANTEITFTFKKPDGTIVIKTKTGGEVVLGVVPLTLPTIGPVLANEYAYYDIEPGFLDQASIVPLDWCSYITYTNTVPAPDDVFIGTAFNFTVSATPC